MSFFFLQMYRKVLELLLPYIKLRYVKKSNKNEQQIEGIQHHLPEVT